MKITSITIEGMHNVAEKTYTFNNLNYLHGPNGAGKSTALQAVQLALLGYIPGVDKKVGAIFKHAKNKTMVITCRLDDDGKEVVVSRSFAGTGKTVTKAVEVTPPSVNLDTIFGELELPIFNFSDFLNLSANKMKEWFIGFLPGSNDEVDWKKELTDALGDKKVIDEDLIEDTINDINREGKTGIDLVRATNARLKERISFEKGNLDRTSKTIQSLVFYDDIDANTNVESVQADIDKLNNQLIHAAKVETVRESNRRIKEQIAAIHAEGSSLEDDKEYAARKKTIADMNEQIEKYDRDLTHLKAVEMGLNDEIRALSIDIEANKRTISGDGVCPYTSEKCVSIESFISEVKEKVSAAEEELKKKKEELMKTQSTIQNTIFARKSAQETKAQETLDASAIELSYQNIKDLRSRLQMEDLIDGEEKTALEIKQEISKLNELLVKVAANKQYTQLMEKLTADKFRQENTIEVLKIWDKLTSANGLQATLSEKPFEELAESMTAYLHKLFGKKDICAKFFLSNEANSFSFGIMRQDKYISYEMLSSGEKCLYTLALMMCLLSRSDSRLKVILIDDLLDHLDDGNAAKLFDALYKIKDIQIILAGVKECTSSHKDDIVIEVK